MSDLPDRLKKILSPGVKAQLESIGLETPVPGLDSRTLMSRLTSKSRLAVESQLDRVSEADRGVARYALVECNDGEWPKLLVFDALEDLAARIKLKDGEDCVVWPFFGVPIEITSGKNRLLVLPGPVGVPLDEPGRRVDLSGGGFAVQEDGFLGPPDFAAPPLSDRTVDEADTEGEFD